MSSPEPSAGPAAGAPPRFSQQVRQRISAIPERIAQPERALTGFSIARIYTTFQLKRGEYFPEGLSDAAFDMLMDLFLYDSLNRRVGSSSEGGLRIEHGQGWPAGVCELVETGFVALTPGEGSDGTGSVLNLSRSGRARLNIFFDYMANYISAI